jgi:threonine dehydratase
MILPTLDSIETATGLVHGVIAPTPQIRWPLLCARTGVEVWIKHENHTPVGAFKLRGGLVYMDELSRREPELKGVITASRGNHGQSIAFAARRAGLFAVVVVPHGNSPEKNAAMRALGAELIEHGADFQEAYEHAMRLAATEGLHPVHSFDPTLVRGVATYALELFRGVADLDAVYVPIGMGTGICGTIAVRDALGLRTEIVGVVAEQAPAYARSWAAGEPVAATVGDTIADGLACRVPDREALGIIRRRAARILTVSESEIRTAMRHLFSDTHNAAEGAGAAPLAGLFQERERMLGRRVAVVLSGGNVDAEVFARVLAEP